MRLIKAQNTNLRSITGKGVQYGIDDLVTVDSTNSMIVPKGTGDPAFSTGTSQNQRPPTPINGMMRYNTTDNQFEVYQNSQWREIRFKEPNQDPGIVWQQLGVGDATETVFGELNSNDTDFPVPDAAESIIVLIENVIQIPTTNYTIHQTAEITTGGADEGPNAPYTESDTGWWIKFTSAVPFGKPVTVIHNLDK
jgi:hypothetical protein